MNSNSTTLIRLDRSQIKQAARVLAGVFFNDPVYVFFFPDSDERKDRLHQHFEIRLKHCLSNGECYATSPNMEGIAMWFPPDYSKLTLPKILRWGAVPILSAIFSGSGRKAISRQMSVNKFLNSLHEQINFSNQWYLSSIGVNLEYQKKGHGSILLRSMLSRFEKDKVSCFLDTQKKENIPLYEHFGFKIVKEAIIPGTDIRTCLMSTSR